MTKVWFEDPRQLIRQDKISQFWPNNKQTPAERVNSASRFIIYTTCFLYLIRRDIRVFVLGATSLGVLYVMYRSNMIKETYGVPTRSTGSGCQMPSGDNPMGNVLLTDITDRPNRPPACEYSSVRPIIHALVDQRVPFDAGRSRSPLPHIQRKAASRQFITAPVSMVPGDQTAFAEWLYGPKNGVSCKGGSQFACNPNARGVQLEAFAGIGSDGDKRSGMHGFTHV
jgi:hypothetical protein|tara:strand:- start:114 stop:791 length:678 start_codon:yes stop_codon:yes gene_type:complete